MNARELLRLHDFRLLFTGQVWSQLGDAVYETGIVWLVYQMTASAAAVGWLVFCQTVPYLVFGVIAGAYADRFDRRMTMLLSDLVRGLAVLYLALRESFGSLSVVEVCAVAALLTTARTFFHPSMRALFPQLLPREELMHANSLSEGAKRICKVIGMLLGGLLMTGKQADLILWGNAVSFFLSLWTIARIRSRTHRGTNQSSLTEKAKQSVWRGIQGAAREIFQQRAALFAIVLSSLGLIVSAGMIKIGLPLLAARVLHQQGDVYGLLMACFSVGMFLSAALMKKMSRLPVFVLVLIGWTLYGLMFLSLSITHVLVVAAILVCLTGFAHFLTDIPVTTLLQQKMPLERMSACQSVWATSSFGSESLSVAVTGAILGLCSVSIGFLAAGGILFLLGGLPLIKICKNGHITLDRRTMT